jgi:hypothetical protein
MWEVAVSWDRLAALKTNRAASAEPRGNAMNIFELLWLVVLAAVVGLVVWRTLRGMERRRRMR